MAQKKIRIQLDGERYYDVQVYNNQKVIHINKLFDKGMILDTSANKQALQNLTLAGYALYSHLMLNMPGWLEALSKKRLTEITPLTSKTYDAAVKDLIDKKYLVKKSSQEFEEYYEFYEVPEHDFAAEKENRKIKTKNASESN